jgi:hypothetical protein
MVTNMRYVFTNIYYYNSVMAFLVIINIRL